MLRRTALIWQLANCFENMPRTLFCYLLLLFIFHWDQYKVFWWAHLKHTSLGRAEHDANHEHLFIYSSFIYDRRPPANFSGLGKVQLVVLFLADKFHRTSDRMQCVVTKNAISVQKMALQKELIHSLGICALDLFVLTCSLDGLRRDSALFDGGAAYRNMYSLALTDVDWYRMQRKSTKLTLYPRQPSYKPRGLVLCMSRVFLFEKWQLLITALETYRLFKVDLVVAYVQSALLAVFELMKAYEQHGLLQVRPGIRFPHQRGMPWDPNAETEFNGQILLAHDCFYEYRESAQFIGLIDWDDLLVPSVHFGTLPEAFAAAFTVNPDTAYFLVNKLEASFEEQPVTRPTRFNLRKLLTHGIRTAEMYNDEKMVVRPKALRGFWMHNSFNLETMKRAVKMFTNYTILLHLANEQSRAFKLPTAQPFYAALVACHSQIFAYFKSTDMNKSRCLSYSLCVLPTLPEAICAVSRSVFGTVVTKGAKAVLHVRERSEFTQDKCSDEGGL